MAFKQNLQGRTVYGQGSYAPTRGPVSARGAQGYLQRELRNRNRGNVGVFGGVSRLGGDGQSDTRSGIARQAMDRMGITSWQGQGGVSKLPKTPQNKVPTETIGKPPVGVPRGTTPTTPGVVINPSGQLELPYSPAWSEEVLSGLQNTNAELAALQQAQQAQSIAYQQNVRNAGNLYTTQQRTTLNDQGSRGTVFSSGHGVAKAMDANNYNNQLNALATENTQANLDFDFQRTAITNAFKDLLRQASLNYGNSLSEEVGSLGYGSPGSWNYPYQVNGSGNNKGKGKKKKK